jgi:hypothetical protein
VTLFVLLVKMVLFIMHYWWPLIGLLVNTGLVAVWTVSVYGQMGPDYADPRYPSPIAWYISKGCGPAGPYGLTRSCQLAQASFGVSVLMLAIYTANLGLAAHAMWPREGAEYRPDDEDDMESGGAGYSRKEKAVERVEMQSIRSPTMQSMRSPTTPGRTMPGLPYTPRTQAFHTLDRQLPLRHG